MIWGGRWTLPGVVHPQSYTTWPKDRTARQKGKSALCFIFHHDFLFFLKALPFSKTWLVSSSCYHLKSFLETIDLKAYLMVHDNLYLCVYQYLMEVSIFSYSRLLLHVQSHDRRDVSSFLKNGFLSGANIHLLQGETKLLLLKGYCIIPRLHKKQGEFCTKNLWHLRTQNYNVSIQDFDET